MIYIKMLGHEFKYEIEDILRLFRANITEMNMTKSSGIDMQEGLFDGNLEVIVTENEPPNDFRGIFLVSVITNKNNSYTLETSIKKEGAIIYSNVQILDLIAEGISIIDSLKVRKRLKWEIKREVYLAISSYTTLQMPWGISTGVRPAKIVQEMLDKAYDNEKILEKMEAYYMLSPKKAELLLSVSKAERKILQRTAADRIGLYIGIPFCTTRCLYCSFTSNLIAKYKGMLSSYLSALKHEISGVSKLISANSFKIQSVYIGGGTPTSIDAESLKELLYTVEKELDLSFLEEYTLEAGRPDSIDADKLRAIKNSRVDRISINPQSMNQKTLDVIGRKHTPEDVINIFNKARHMGFNNINMDIIAGLPGENLEMFQNTLEQIEKLAPDNLTVHTMAVKTASRLKEQRDMYELISGDEAAKMVDLSEVYAEKLGMKPYYLYRQKNIIGNLENVGFCKPGLESIYNVQIMEEKQTIIAVGAGAVTKVFYPSENRLERAFNVKSVEDYIKRVDEMLLRKSEILNLLGRG